MLYFIGRSFFFVFCKLYLRFTVVGRENIPKRGSFIFASNHTSFLDPILLGASTSRGLYYMARDTLFKKACFGWVMRNLHAFSVKRHENRAGALKQAIRILAEGRPLVIFPEGTRSKGGRLRKGKPGIGFIAAKANVPIVPAYVKGSFAAMPGGVKTLKRVPVAVYIGTPIYLESALVKGKGRDLYQEISERIIGKIIELKEAHEGTPC